MKTLWVCAVCGTPEKMKCKHTGTEFYALISRQSFRSAQKIMGEAKEMSAAKRIIRT